MKSVIFIAPPAAGKGTQSKMLASKYHMAHISTGDLLRDAVNDGSSIGLEIQKQMKLGNLVSDEVILDLLTKRLEEDDCNNGYILDGFPRNVQQAIKYNEILKKLNKDLGVVIYLDIAKQVAKDRITGRISCPNCGAIYNEKIDELKPTCEGICDKCSTALVKREDDNEETFENRFDTYMEKTKPLIEFYEKQGNLYRIDKTDKDEVFAEIEHILGASND